MKTEELTYKIIGAAYEVHGYLGGGFLEKVYENALAVELKKQGLRVLQQYEIPVYYKDELVGDYVADLIVNGKVIIELKAITNLSVSHEVQLVNYLTATNRDIGLLINFGDKKVTIKKKFREYKKG